FEEGEHVEVAVSFGELSPKLSCNVNHRLNPQSVKLNLTKPVPTTPQGLGISSTVEVFANFTKGIQRVVQRLPASDGRCKPSRRTLQNLKYRPVAQQLEQFVHHPVQRAISFAGLNFVGAQVVGDFIGDVAEIHGVHGAHAQVHRKLQPRLA